QWIVCGLGETEDARDRDAEFAQRDLISRDQLLSTLRNTLKEADATLSRISPEKLLEQKTIQGLEVLALPAILHLVEHFSMHTGQIILLTKQLTRRDMHFYDFAGDTPSLRWSSHRS